MSRERQTLAGAYMKIAAHEELCAERYRGINEKLSWVLGGLATMLLGLLAWALVQIYTLEPLRTHAAPARPRAELEGHRSASLSPCVIARPARSLSSAEMRRLGSAAAANSRREEVG